jgi:hypothetical protein
MVELKCCGKECENTHGDSGYDYYICRICKMQYVVQCGEDLWEE